MQLPNTKVLIIIAGVILVILVAVTIFVNSLVSKNQSSQQNPTLIPTGIFESSGNLSDNQSVNLPTLTQDQKQSAIAEITTGISNNLPSDQATAFNNLIAKLPYSSSDFDMIYSSGLNQFIVSKKTSNADNKLNQFLQDNNALDLYQNNQGLFVVGTDSINTLTQNEQNDLIAGLAEQEDLSTTSQEQQQNQQNNNQSQQNKNTNQTKQKQSAIQQKTKQEIDKEVQSLGNIIGSLFNLNFSDELKINQSNAPGPSGNTNNGGPSGTGTPGSSGSSWLAQYGNVSTNIAKTTQLKTYILNRWPSLNYAGTCNCRPQRGTGSNPNMWSIHSWCGAIDFFGPTYSTSDPVAKTLYSWANSSAGKALGIVFALSEASPGDIHVQIIPNQVPSDLVPQCAGGPSS